MCLLTSVFYFFVAASTTAPPREIVCPLAIVGAGAGGTYTAWRASTAPDSPLHPGDICVFERSTRVGGRTFTLHHQGPSRDLNVDLGATVFCGQLPRAEGDCNGMETPLMMGVIKKALQLNTSSYRDTAHLNPPGDKGYKGCEKIVVAAGSRETAGFGTYIETMAKQATIAGTKFYFEHELITVAVNTSPPKNKSATATPQSVELLFANGVVVRAARVLLNLPAQPMQRLLRRSPSLRPWLAQAPYGGRFLRAPHGWRLFKLLLHYDWAWWRALGLLDGAFDSNTDACRPSPCPLCSCNDDLPIAGRYHDAHVICDDGNQTGMHCRGYLQAVYTSDGEMPVRVSAWEHWSLGTDPPYSRITRNNSADGEWLLTTLHTSLLSIHEQRLKAAGLWDSASLAHPNEALLLLLWDPKTKGFGGATHGFTPSSDMRTGCGNSQGPCHLQSAQLEEGWVTRLAATPFKRLPMHIANEAYHPSDWGEGSLQMAENMLHSKYNLSRPWWVDPEFYTADVLYPTA